MDNPSVNIYLTKPNGTDYYFGVLQPDGSYLINSSTTPTPIMNLPSGWQDTQINWDRDNTFLGIFTTQSQTFKFVNDARGILLALYYASNGGIQADCLMRVDIFQDVFTGYITTYECEIDFSKASDQKYQGNTDGIGNPPKQGEFSVPTLNARLNELWMAYGDTEFNIPIWTIDPITGIWYTAARTIWHSGIKLRYSAAYISSATATQPISAEPGDFLYGFNHGSVSNGRHWLAAMSNYNITQNNGTTTCIGNDILNPFLLQRDEGYAYEQTFWGVNDSRPFSRDAYLLKNILNNASGNLDISITLAGTFKNPIVYDNGLSFTQQFIGFVLFEIGDDDHPVMLGGNMQYTPLLKCFLPTTGSPYTMNASTSCIIGTGGAITSIIDALGNFTIETPITINYNKCYVLGVIYDDDGVSGISGHGATFQLSDLKITFNSTFNSGTAAPVNAPIFPGSPVMGFSASQLLSQIVPMLNSTQTDAYGFPIVPAGTPYTGTSNFLSTDAVVYDNSPTRTLFFSSNSLQLLQGYPFISMSVNKLAKFCFNTWGCGLAIKGNTIEIEDLAHYFQDIMILDLADNVADMKIEPLTEIMNCELQTGYNTQNTNNDFGVDIYAKELDFTTPLSKVPGTTLSIINSIIADMYPMEKRRAQQVTGSLPTSGNGQSNGNETYVVEFDPAATYPGLVEIQNPAGGSAFTVANLVKQFHGAQSTNALLADYIYGLFYPDTALNLGITPIKNLYRLGSYLRSMLDGQDSQNLVFRKIYQMLYNNISELIPGIKTNNLYGTGGITIQECTDILISDLSPTQLFRPYKISLRTISAVNTWQVMNTNPNGYVQFNWKGIVWKGFVSKINQNIALSKPTNFILWAHPSVTNAMLINA